ncbi:MAG: HprK-related kinase A [Pseudomonadales bacterium]|nr:HprK-related kinase A [Halioglobus sp.]MCP5129880.1 HprK-related kinase A [Pseudomonadales bacterium]
MPLRNTLSSKDVGTLLKAGELSFRVGPYIYNLHSSLGQLAEGLSELYADFPAASPGDFVDYAVSIQRGGPLSTIRRKVQFLFDNQGSFAPIPIKQAYAFMEWGMNWCVSVHANEYLKLHAAAVARDGLVIVMPGVPGAGKSTLCAALGLTGWRILSDEHALIPPGTSRVVPLCRPVSLKNESIETIRAFDRSARFGPVSKDTHKGAVAHMKADLTPDCHDQEALPAHIMLFPRYSSVDRQELTARSKTESFVLAAYHSFNYSLMGESGFAAMQTLIDSVECYDLVYRDLDWAIEAVGQLHDRARQP